MNARPFRLPGLLRGAARSSRLAMAALAALAMAAGAAFAQAPDEAAQQREPSLAEMEATLESLWARSLALDGHDDPLVRVQTFQTLLVQELMLANVRAMAAGVAENRPPQGTAVRDQVFARWRREKPRDPLPDLVMVHELEDPQERLAATLALLARHPDDLALVSAASQQLRHQEGDRAAELLEGFLQRHPKNPYIWRLLAGHYGATNRTKQAELIARWTQHEPLTPDAVGAWLDSALAEQEPAATEALLERFFAGSAAGQRNGRRLPRGRAAIPLPSRRSARLPRSHGRLPQR